jgi:hypothetical protein
MDIRFSWPDKWFIGRWNLPLVHRDISLDGDGKIGNP